jgi:hypothetical protein
MALKLDCIQLIFSAMIRFSFNYLRPVALFLSVIVMFQCCKVYHKETVSLDEALESDIKRVKIITKDDREFVFDSIYYTHDKLYGHLISIKGKNKTENAGININKESIKSIHFYNKSKSGKMTALVVIGGIVGGVGLIIIIGSYIAISYW